MNHAERKSNFELLRIICMVMIVALHTINHGGALESLHNDSFNYYIAHFIEAFSIVAVNCYILVSGYFGLNSKFKLNKIIKIYIQAIFYSVLISLVFWISGIEKISLSSIISTMFPIMTQVWWFITLYLVLYLIAPYINKLLLILTQKEESILICILTFIFIIWPSLILKVKPIDNSLGFSLYQFIYLYIIGAFLNKKLIRKSFKKRGTLFIYIISSIMLVILNVIINRISKEPFNIYSYNFILVFISSVSLFLFFKEINIQGRLINKVSSLTLGVYLIHDHTYVRNYIYGLFNYSQSFYMDTFFIYTIIIVLSIFFGALAIEAVRQVVFNELVRGVSYVKNKRRN